MRWEIVQQLTDPVGAHLLVAVALLSDSGVLGEHVLDMQHCLQDDVGLLLHIALEVEPTAALLGLAAESG